METDETDKEDFIVENERKSIKPPAINDYFTQTVIGKENSNQDNVFEQANEEKDEEYFRENDKGVIGEEDEEAEEDKSPDNKPIFSYKIEKYEPHLYKSKSKINRDSAEVRKLAAPPKNSM
eukprot:scpid96710/ scgid24998/ 